MSNSKRQGFQVKTKTLTWSFAVAACLAFGCSSSKAVIDPPALVAPAVASPEDCVAPADSPVQLGKYVLQDDNGVALFFNEAVTMSDRERVVAGLDAVRGYIDSAAARNGNGACIDVRVTPFGLAGSANATGSHIIIFTDPQGWPMPQPWHLQMVTAHEYVHAWQYQVSANTPAAGPTWLIEGSAQYVALEAMLDKGLMADADAKAYLARPFGPLVPPLHHLEEPESFFNIINSPYNLSCAAVDMLVGTRGVGSLATFWGETGRGVAWEDAFLSAFGVTPEDFYSRFDGSTALPTPSEHRQN